jgi:hypothetical protein
MDMKRILAIAILAVQVCVSHSQSKQLERRPNIVVFLVDDMGWQDCSVPFCKERTPFRDEGALQHPRRHP